MEPIYEKFVNSLMEAEKLWSGADHLVCITYPVVKDSKLLIRALENVDKSLVLAISTILKFEYMYKRINLSENTKENLENFFSKCSVNYGLGAEENKGIKEIMLIAKKHKESGFEFSRSGKAMIMDDELGVYELTQEKAKEYLKLVRKVLDGTKIKFKEGF